jgi:hypothetical protein
MLGSSDGFDFNIHLEFQRRSQPCPPRHVHIYVAGQSLWLYYYLHPWPLSPYYTNAFSFLLLTSHLESISGIMRTALSLYLWCLVTLTLILHAPTVISRDSGRFVLKDEFRGHNFYDGWNWETFNDPTHGRVDYVSQSTSRARNLSFGWLKMSLLGDLC